MNPTLRAILLPGITMCVGLAQTEAPVADPAQDDALIAVVGTQEIRANDLLAEFNRQIPLYFYHRKVPETELARLRRIALDQLIEKALVHQDALQRGIKASEEEVRAELQKALAATENHAVADREFAVLLVEYRPLLERRILLDKNEARFTASVPKPDAAGLATVYEQLRSSNAESLQAPAEARLQQIFIPVDPSASTEVFAARRLRIEAARQLLLDGRPFEEVARRYSEDDAAPQGGDLGVVPKGRLKSRTVDDAAFALAEGEQSPVIQSLYGYHILRCVRRLPPRLSTIDEALPQLEAWFIREHVTKARKAWLDAVRERLGVKIVAPEFTAAAPAAKAGTDRD